MSRPIIFDILAVDEASRTFTKVGLAAGSMGTKVESAGKIASKGFLYAGVAAGALGVHAIKMAGDFDAAIVRLETTAGESHKALGMVSSGLLDMAGKVGYSAQELAKGMYTVESAGYHGAAGLKVMEAAAKGARVEGADLTATTNAVSSLLVDYHLKAGDAARVTNVLTAAVGHGKTTFEQLATALPNVAAAGATAKISMEEIASAIATMTMHGTDAAKAGTYLRQVIGQLEAPSAKASKVMSQLGIDSNHLGQMLSSGSGHGLADAIKMVDDAITKHLTPSGLVALDTFTKSKKPLSDYKKVLADLPDSYITSFGALSKMVGGVKSLQGFLQLGGENLKTYSANVAAVREQVRKGGNDVEGFGQQQDTLNGKLADAEGAASAFAISLGQKLEPAAKATTDIFTSFVGVLSNHIDATTKVVEGAVLVGGAMLAMKAATSAAAVATAFLGGEEGVLAIRMAAGALATGDMAGAAIAAKWAVSGMTTAIRVGAGAAGLGLLAVSSSTTNQSLGVLTRTAGAMAVGFSAGGPWGAAIGGATALVYSLVTATDRAGNSIVTATMKTKHWTDALNGLTDANSAAARSEAATTVEKLEKHFKLAASGADTLGLKQRDLVSYLTNEGDARKRIDALIEKGTKAKEGSAAYNQAWVLRTVVIPALLNEGSLLGDVIDKNKKHAAAVQTWSKALRGVPKNVQSELKNKNYDLTLKQVYALEQKYKGLDGKQVATILKALGYDVTLKQLAAIGTAADRAAKPRTIKFFTKRVGPSGNVGPGAVLNNDGTPDNNGNPNTAGRQIANSITHHAIPGFTTSGHHLSATFIDAIANGIRKGKFKMADALSKVNDLFSRETDKLNGLLSKRNDIVQGFAGMTSSVFAQDLSGAPGGASVAGLIGYQQAELTKALQVQADVAKLVSEGLSKALVTQLANSGATGAANLHALAMGSPSDIATLNALNAQTSAALTSGGMIAGNDLYGSQIQAATRDKNTAEAIVRELEKWRKQQDKNTVIELHIGPRAVQASLLELKRHQGGKSLGLS